MTNNQIFCSDICLVTSNEAKKNKKELIDFLDRNFTEFKIYYESKLLEDKDKKIPTNFDFIIKNNLTEYEIKNYKVISKQLNKKFIEEKEIIERFLNLFIEFFDLISDFKFEGEDKW